MTATVMVVLVLGAATPALAAEPIVVDDPVGSAQLLVLANGERSAAGLPLLEAGYDVTEVAIAHSRRMATAGDIFHNDDYFTPSMRQRLGARSLGENVALNTSVDDAHRRLMLSAAHRANLMNPKFTVVGMAVVRDVAGTGFITQNFVEPVAAAPRPAGAAAPAPPPEPAPTPSPTDAPAPADEPPVVADDDRSAAAAPVVPAGATATAIVPVTAIAAGAVPAAQAATSGSAAGAPLERPADAAGAATTTTALETVSVVTEPISTSITSRQASSPSGASTSPLVLVLAAVAILMLVTTAAARSVAARGTEGGPTDSGV